MPPKKDDAKPATPVYQDPFVEIVFFLMACFMVVFIVNGLLSMFANHGISLFDFLYQARDFIIGDSAAIWIVRIVLVALSVILVLVLSDIIFKLSKFRKEQHKLFYPDITVSTSGAPINAEWQQILEHIETANENDWRQAIISADIMLEKLLNTMNLPGDTIGDKLKAVATGDFKTLDNAWEAHKVRNQIAHEGPAFILTARTARETISNYEAVFNEFKII